MKRSIKITIIVLGLLLVFMIIGIWQTKTLNNIFNLDLPNSKDEKEGEENDKMENLKNINVIINNKNYIATLEDNETVKEFLNLLPQEFTMTELNGNEKYFYMEYTLPTNETNPKQIVAGDIMLYGNNCLVIFYKSFTTSYNYTKIGHIANLDDLGNDRIVVKFTK